MPDMYTRYPTLLGLGAGFGALLSVIVLSTVTAASVVVPPTTTTTVVPSTTSTTTLVPSTTTTVPSTTTTLLVTTTTVPPTTTTTLRPWRPADECADVSRPVSAGAMRWCGWVAHYLYLTRDWQPGDLTRLMRTMDCESGGDPNAKNPRSTASGLFQFLDGSFTTWGPRAAAFFGFNNPTKNMPLDNIAAAVLYYVNAGPGPWPNCGRR